MARRKEERMPEVWVGWFGIPGEHTYKSSTKTHIVNGAAVPVCGSKVRKGSEFQVCYSLSHPVNPEKVECVKCVRSYRKMVRDHA